MLKYKIEKVAFDALDDSTKVLYAETSGSYVLQVEGVKTQADVDNVKEALRKEKEDHDATRKVAKENDATKKTLEDKIRIYETDPNKKMTMEERVEFERLKRENETVIKEREDLRTSVEQMKQSTTRAQIKDHLRKEAVGVIREEAIEFEIEALVNDFVVSDGKILTTTTLGAKSGLEAKAYLATHVASRSYLVPTSSGGGAGGNKGSGGGAHEKVDNSVRAVVNDAWAKK